MSGHAAESLPVVSAAGSEYVGSPVAAQECRTERPVGRFGRTVAGSASAGGASTLLASLVVPGSCDFLQRRRIRGIRHRVRRDRRCRWLRQPHRDEERRDIANTPDSYCEDFMKSSAIAHGHSVHRLSICAHNGRGISRANVE